MESAHICHLGGDATLATCIFGAGRFSISTATEHYNRTVEAIAPRNVVSFLMEQAKKGAAPSRPDNWVNRGR